MKDYPALRESAVEQAIIGNLQAFLLELGKGFSFVARQKRLRFEEEDFYVDLVFYNYLLKCFVLVDLKVGKLTHQDIPSAHCLPARRDGLADCPRLVRGGGRWAAANPLQRFDF